MAKKADDAPWSFTSPKPYEPNAGRPLPPMKTRVRVGERVSLIDPQHRTKGAKHGAKMQLSQGNNFPRPDAGTPRKKRSAGEERRRARRRMRREMERRNRYMP